MINLVVLFGFSVLGNWAWLGRSVLNGHSLISGLVHKDGRIHFTIRKLWGWMDVVGVLSQAFRNRAFVAAKAL
ncbi:hypothetical protein FN846DRAFT_937617 [Sphaerosporella brunnea]|uniref:Uncharacterized protein n=1 Tax=Sphaerosporella brunnea TaxID=1250544 RepID=A0A5J5F385_9PEZI|nr:hypothetical protein FN846DRAFT_937617 [Sphaerosporella brunnea]